jgi:hypothetical protein
MGRRMHGEAALSVSPSRLRLGGHLQLCLQLRSTSRQAQALEIDYVVLHVKADGSRSPKVFKGWRLRLPAGQSVTLEKRHPMRAITTRRYHTGTHGVVLRINGQDSANAEFELLTA